MAEKDNVSVDQSQLFRGETPEDIDSRCLKLCQDYIGSVWSQQTVDSIRVTRILGGLSNQIYRCAIKDPVPGADAPHEVAITFFGKKWFKVNVENPRLSDIIVAIMVSANGLGPKVYGIFDGGMIQQFYHHRQFKLEEQKDEKLSTELFQKLARMNAMDVPLRKKAWFLDELNRSYKEFTSSDIMNKLLVEENCEQLLEPEFKVQLDWICREVTQLNSPLVFSHNDLISSNIMVTDKSLPNGDRIVICDFEHAGYEHRGIDLGFVLSEWGRLWASIDVPQSFVDDSTIIKLLEVYVNEMVKIFGNSYTDNPINSMKQLVKEVKVFALAFKMLMILFYLDTVVTESDVSIDAKTTVNLANKEYQNYWILKEIFEKQNVF